MTKPMSKILNISKRQPLLPGMPTTAAQSKLEELQAAQVFVDAFIVSKDRERAEEAVEYKLRCQREYVIWRDAPHGRGDHGGDRTSKQVSALKVALPLNDPGDLTAHRWRKTLKDQLAYERTVAKSKTKVISMLERGSIRQKDLAEFFTPAPIIELARAVLGKIDLDPASCPQAQRIVRATRFLSKEDDGLKHSWRGKVWLNPPFGRDIVPQFVDKLLTEIAAKRAKSAIMLVNNCTETKWFANAAKSASAICFHTGRMIFETASEPHEVTQGQALFYWGNTVKRFEKEFSTVGWIAIPNSK